MSRGAVLDETHKDEESDTATYTTEAESCSHDGESPPRGRTDLEGDGIERGKRILFLYRMDCISKKKEKLFGDKKVYDMKDSADFTRDVMELQSLWEKLTLKDVCVAAACCNLNKLFEMVTLRFPKVKRTVKLPEIGEKDLYQLVWHRRPDSVFFSSLRGRRRFFLFDTAKETNKDMEGIWRKPIEESFTNRSWGDDCLVQVDVAVVGVALMRQPDADLVLMLALSKSSPKAEYAVSAHAFLYMCWWKQMPLYLANVAAALASIVALIDTTLCAKVSCTESYHNISPLVVLCVSLWFLITDAICASIIFCGMGHFKSCLKSVFQTRGLELLLEMVTLGMATQMARHGWRFATMHHVQYFFIVSCRWLHLLYMLIPVPFLGRTVLPMYQSVFSYGSRGFMAVNLVVLAGTFQAYIGLRLDINAQKGDLSQPIGDALLAQYRLNFLGDFSTDDLMGESQKVNPDGGIVTTQIGSSAQRQGIAAFLVFTTFIQAVLMLNLYIGILGESYTNHKKNVEIEFMRFRANFMMKNLWILRFLSHAGLERIKGCLEGLGFEKDTKLLWAISPHEDNERGEVQANSEVFGDLQSRKDIEKEPENLGGLMDALRWWRD